MSEVHALSKSVMTDGGIGQNVLGGAFTTPLVILKNTAVAKNVERMSQYLADRGVSIAPHAKTAMAPDLFQRQLDAGAWGLTVATMSQVQVLCEFGVKRILLANQLVDPAAIRWIADRLVEDKALQFMCFVDSEPGVRVLKEFGEHARFDVLLEVGALGARTGVRSDEETLAVADAIRDSENARLVGVAGYEGAVPGGKDRPLIVVDEYLEKIKDVAVRLFRAGYFDSTSEVVVTAGGSLYFDRVVEILGRPWSLPTATRLVLRCGSYIAYDSGRYLSSSPFAERVKTFGPPEPALELWATVQSRPEPALAFMNFGKRDVPFDDGLPVPVAGRSRQGDTLDVDGLVVSELNDHHAYISVPTDHPLAVGDRVGFGLRHPCTAFDKWRFMPVVDDDYVVLDLIETRF